MDLKDLPDILDLENPTETIESSRYLLTIDTNPESIFGTNHIDEKIVSNELIYKVLNAIENRPIDDLIAEACRKMPKLTLVDNTSGQMIQAKYIKFH